MAQELSLFDQLIDEIDGKEYAVCFRILSCPSLHWKHVLSAIMIMRLYFAVTCISVYWTFLPHYILPILKRLGL